LKGEFNKEEFNKEKVYVFFDTLYSEDYYGLENIDPHPSEKEVDYMILENRVVAFDAAMSKFSKHKDILFKEE
jgi:hypothetical protein